jgi:serine/threonine-protein kinase
MKECSNCQSCFPDSVESCEIDGLATKHTLPIENILNERYRLKKRIGQGSVSIVYLATDLIHNTKHAVRIVLPDLIGHDQELARRFLDEATATSVINHPNIVGVTDAGMLNGAVPFVVLELVSGASLHDKLSTDGPLHPFEAFEYVSKMGSALAAAHKLGIVHGDLKPKNILLDHDLRFETLKISDFGLSGLKSGKIEGPLATPKTTAVLRAPLYLAPEQWSDSEPDSRSDIYSLGVILYQMLAGELPFKGKSTVEVMKQHLMKPPPPLIERASISSELETAVMHALAKEPEERPDTVEAFIGELELAIMSGEGGFVTGAGEVKSTEPEELTAGQVVASSDFDSSQVKIKEQDLDFDGQITIINGSVFEKHNNAGSVASDQNVVISATPAETNTPAKSAVVNLAETIAIVRQPAGDEDVVPASPAEPDTIDLDQTLVNSKKPIRMGSQISPVAHETDEAALPEELDQGQITLVNFAVPAPTKPTPPPDVEQTNILTAENLKRHDTAPLKVTPNIRDDLSKRDHADFDKTIVPGKIDYSVSDDEPVGSAEQTAVDGEEMLEGLPFMDTLEEKYQAPTLQKDEDYATNELPRSIPIVVLAVGVIVVVLLIAVGVYYSRISQ